MFRRLIGLLTVAVTGLFLASTAFAQISGTGHDFGDGLGFGADAWNATGEICVVCHTPHSGDTNVTDAPLWDHEITTFNTYTLYTSGTLNATAVQPALSPAPLTRLCLSCHDGTVGLDNFGGTTGATGNELTAVSTAYVGTDFSDDHPVSIPYNGVAADLNAAPTNPATVLYGGNVECASCHEVHNGAGVASLLVMDNAGSDMCLSCHDK